MAIGVLLDIPGGTQEQYEEINQKAFGDPKGPSEPPAGLITHTAGATSSGWRIFDVWETQEDLDRFNETYIMPAVQGMDLPQIPPETYELSNLITTGVTARTT